MANIPLEQWDAVIKQAENAQLTGYQRDNQNAYQHLLDIRDGRAPITTLENPGDWEINSAWGLPGYIANDAEYQSLLSQMSGDSIDPGGAIAANKRREYLENIYNTQGKEGILNDRFGKQFETAKGMYVNSLTINKDGPTSGSSWWKDFALPAAALLAVVATAGAGAAALGAGVSAGEAVAGGAALGAGSLDAAVTSAVTTAAAASPAAAAAVASIPAVHIVGSAAAAGALSGAELLAAAGVAGAGAMAAGGLPGSSYQSANYGGPEGEGVPNNTVDPNIQRVDVTGHLPGGGGDTSVFNSGSGLGAVTPGALPGTALPDLTSVNQGGYHIPESDLPPLEMPNLNPMDPDAITMPAPDNSWVPGSGLNLPRLPNLPGGNKDNSSGGSLNPLLVGGALALFMSGLKDAPDNPELNGSISKLNKQGDDQMAQWNEWMFPTLKNALADNKSATDAYLNASNVNAGKLEGMGDLQRQYAQEMYDRNKNVYIPQADKIIADANAFDKQGFGAQQAGLAIGDLQSAYAAQRQQQQQNLAQYGIAPTSGRALAMDNAGAINNAAGMASAATRARMAAEELWGTKQMNALNTSGVLNANANAYAGLNAGAGSLYTNANNVRGQGTNATSQYFTNADSLAKTTSNTYTSANNAYNGAGTLALGKSKLDNDRYMAEQQGRGTVLGAGLQALGGNGGIGSATGNTIGSVVNGVKDVVNTGKSIYDWGSKLFS